MTSRTIDIHCHACGKYMHSELPSGNWNAQWVKKHFCKKKSCQEQATFDKLQGPEPLPSQEELIEIVKDMVKEIKKGA